MGNVAVVFDIYSASILITLIFLIITIVDVLTNRLITKRNKRISILVCLFIAISAVGEYLGVVTNGSADSLILFHKLAKLAEFCSAPFIGVLAGIAYGDIKKPRLAIGIAGGHAVFEIIACCFGLVFSVDDENIYHRESLYVIYVAAFMWSVVFVFVSILRKSKAYQSKTDNVIILIIILLSVGIGIQFVFSKIRIDYLCIAIVNMLFYIHSCKIILQVDAVTNLLNRRCFDVKITDLTSQSAILIFDADDFKAVNDTYGHLAGDQCLKNIARLLRAVYGEYGLCYRTGGDEFSVILSTGLEKIDELTSCLQSNLEELKKSDERMPGVSIGYAVYNMETSHIQTVLEEADAMLYENKNLRKEKQRESKETKKEV